MWAPFVLLCAMVLATHCACAVAQSPGVTPAIATGFFASYGLSFESASERYQCSFTTTCSAQQTGTAVTMSAGCTAFNKCLSMTDFCAERNVVIVWPSAPASLVLSIPSNGALVWTVDNSQNIDITSVHVARNCMTLSAGLVRANVLVANSLALPSGGLAPSWLNYYEEYDHAVTFSGPSSTPKMLKIVRIGRQVTVYNTQAHWYWSTTSTFFTGTPALPQRFRPVSAFGTDDVFVTYCQVRSNNAFVMGSVAVDGVGVVRIYASTSGGVFPIQGQSGFLRWSATWMV